jgi:dipeptidyl-peptidase-4
MDRSRGFWFSPDSRWLVFEAEDAAEIPVYRIMHQGSDEVPPDGQEDHRYPFAGKPNPKVRLGFLDLTAARGGAPMRWLDAVLAEEGEDAYLARVDWMGAQLVVQVLNREQSRLSLVRVDLESARHEVLLRETSAVWINLHKSFRPIPKAAPTGFLWISERSGFAHLELHDAQGALLNILTEGNWQVDGLLDVDEEKRLAYFASNKDAVLERHLFVVPLDGSAAPRRLTTAPGEHLVNVLVATGTFIDEFTSTIDTLRVDVCSLEDGRSLRQLFQNTDRRLGELRLQPPEFFSTPSADGTVTLQGSLMIPDAALHGPPPYPTVVSTYGGPHVQFVRNSWRATADMRAQHLRQQGYLVAKLDNRGAQRYGLAFEGAVKHDLGHLEVEDQAAGVQYAIARGLADAERVGIYGWSYGGYMAPMCLAKRPDVFHAAVSGAPVTHWDGYDTCYTERYMGTPQSNPAGYASSSLLAAAASICGKLLIVHGLLDENVHFRHTARLLTALINAQIHHELLVYPAERHVPRNQKDRGFMEAEIFRFLERSLKGK